MKMRFLHLTLLCIALLISSASATVHASPAAAVKDEWISVRSKNFFLVGNASEKDIRAVATKLEQFRETFRQIFSNAKFTQSVQTNVVVFKNSSAYNPFRPKRGDGKPDENIAGYFQKGEDVNYITLSTDGELQDIFGTIFHEYVHFLIDTNFGKSEVPPWFNEGLAEYYQTFKIVEDQKVTLGSLQNNHLALLQQNRMIPLKEFFEIDNYSLHRNGNHSRSIFYAQAWALMHYLIQGGKGSNINSMGKFLSAVASDVQPEKAFRDAFQTDYATMEKALKDYVDQRRFMTTVVTFKTKLVFDAEMKTAPLSEAEANAYLGDLLYHTHEFNDAEIYLQKSLALDANSSLANTAYGLVKMRQGRFDEAKRFLEKAVASTADRQNHLAHYSYAYVLSREDMDEFGYISRFTSERAAKMRESLQKAININPGFAQSYRLLAFISLVNNENLDEAIKQLRTGLALEPGNQDLAMLAAQIYLRQEKTKEAREIAEKLLKSADEPSLRTSAQKLLDTINRIEETRVEAQKASNEALARGEKPILIRKKSDKNLTAEEIARIKQENHINGLNKLISKPKTDEKQIVGYVEKISCEKGAVIYTIKSDTETLTLTSKDFQSLTLTTFLSEEEAQGVDTEVGCNAKLQNALAVLTYQVNPDPKAKYRGNLLTMEFVPKYFKLKSAEELANARQVAIIDDTENESSGQASEEAKKRMEERRREGILNAIKNALRQPQADETRELGYVERIECSGKTITFVVNINSQQMKLKAKSPQDVRFAAFTPDAQQMQLGCGVKFPPISTVITYRALTGELVALEFVPKSFKLTDK